MLHFNEEPTSRVIHRRECWSMFLCFLASDRKRMSVIVRTSNGTILLFCKGAVSITRHHYFVAYFHTPMLINKRAVVHNGFCDALWQCRISVQKCINSELSHRRRMDSGTVIWCKSRSAHARPPASFRCCQNHEWIFADLSSVQSQERKSQAANQRSCRRRHGMACALHVHALSSLFSDYRSSSICETANEENRGRVTRIVTVDCSSP